MLPILRVIPVGGVLLAIAILLLALNPPGEPRVGYVSLPSRGALLLRELHPEWPQLLWRAALRRAEELKRLRDLPDATITAQAPPAPKAEPTPPPVAAVPGNRNDAEPEDITGTIAQSPDAALPIDIGETSSTELPVIPRAERPAVIKTPERARRPNEGRALEPAKRSQHRTRRTRPGAKPDAEISFIERLFGIGDESGARAPSTQ